MQITPWLAIFVAAVAAWIFGAIYYGVLGRKWVEAQGMTMEECKARNAGKPAAVKAVPFVLSFIAEVVMAWVLSGILFHVGTWTPLAGVISGALAWLGFVLTTIIVNNAYTFRRPMLTIIDSGHWLGALALMGAVLGWLGH
jgi:Protein of unknown function (DUF1761)